MITDLTKASSEQLLALINEENAVNLDFSHIQFQYPTALFDDVDGKDTSVVVNSQPNGGYNGDVIVKYNRLDLNEFTQYGNPELVIPPQGTVEDLVSAFNAFYDASLSLGEDLSTDLSIPADMDYIGKELTLEADESSYAYKGSIVVNVRWETEELSDIIAKGILSGLEYPFPEYRLTGDVETIFDIPEVANRDGVAFIKENMLFIVGGSDAAASGSYTLVTTVNLIDNVVSKYPLNVSKDYQQTGGCVVDDSTVLTAAAMRVSNGNDYLFVYRYTLNGSTAPTVELFQCLRERNDALKGGGVSIIVPKGEKYLVATDGGDILETDINALTATIIHRCIPQIISNGGRDARACLYEGKIYFFGFRSNYVASNVMIVYDVATNTSEMLPATAPVGVWSPGLIGHAGCIYSIGGSNSIGGSLRHIQEYNIETGTWQILSSNKLPLMTRSAMFSHEGEVYAMGGGAYSISTKYGTLLKLL